MAYIEPQSTAPTVARLLVTWQNPDSRAYSRIGILAFSSDGVYEFEYVAGVEELEGFFALAGLDDITETYRSTRLFPVFAERIMDPRRPDFDEWLARLHVERDASPMEILARSNGATGSDTLQLFSIPERDDAGSISLKFFAHGVRHVVGAEELIERLAAGDALELEHEVDNVVDNRALLVAKDGARLGYVPAPLLQLVHVLRDPEGCDLRVLTVNPMSMGAHFRVLIEAKGLVPEDLDIANSMRVSIS